MTLEEFGRIAKGSLRSEGYGPEDIEYISSLPDVVVAQKYLERHPNYWSVLSPSAQRIRGLIGERTTPDYNLPFFKKNKTVEEDRQRRISSIESEAHMVHRLDMLALASETGVPVEMLNYVAEQKANVAAWAAYMREQVQVQVTLMSEEQRLKIEMMQAELDHMRKRLDLEIEYGMRHAHDKRELPPADVRGVLREVLEGEQEEPGVPERGVPVEDELKDGEPDAPRVRPGRHAARPEPRRKKDAS
jgi:hypothetical protein